jgi:hypothetical protein
MLDGNLYVDLAALLRVASTDLLIFGQFRCLHLTVLFLETALKIAEVRGACLYLLLFFATGCQFYPAGEYLRFVRVPENAPVGGEVLQVEVYPRRNLSIQPVDKVRSYILHFLRSYMTR